MSGTLARADRRRKPFDDGNGRLFRVLTTLLLLQAGYSYVPYGSLEKIIEDNRARYYLALRQAQETLTTDNAHLHRWLSFFLSLHSQQVDLLKARIAADHLMQSLPPLSRDLSTMARTRRRITVGDAVAATGANCTTIKVHINRLEARGLLQQKGKGKDTWYEAALSVRPCRLPRKTPCASSATHRGSRG